MKLILLLVIMLSMRAVDLSGKVVDAQGAALPSARVSVRNQSGFIVQEALTDEQGEFRIQGLEPGIYFVAVDAEGLIQSSGPQEVRIDNSGAAPITIRLDLSAVRDSILVSDTRTDSKAAWSASSTYVVSASDLIRAQRPSVLDALRNAPGTNVVQSARRGGVTSLFVRGGESDYTKVLIDGVPVNDAGGAFDFSDLTTDNADRIELVRGAQSALYGSDAMTGVLQFVTRRGTTETPELDISTEGGSFGFNRERAGIAGAFGRFDYAGSFAYLGTNGRDRNDDYANRTASTNLGYRMGSRGQLRLTARSENSGLGVPGATAVFFPDPDERAERRRIVTGVRLDDQTTRIWHQSVAFVYAETDQKGFDPVGQDLTKPNTPPDTFFAFNDFRSFFSNHQRRRGIRYQSDIALPAANLVSAGLDFEQERAVFVSGFDGTNRVAPDRRNIGFFVQDQFTLVARLSVVAGMRVENNRASVPDDLVRILTSLGSAPITGEVGFGTKVVPRIAASYVISRGNTDVGMTRIRAGYGSGIKAPTLLEAFSPSPFFLGNPALKPEQSRSYEIGLDQLLFDERVRIEATWFDGRFRDQIAFVGDPATFGGPITLPDGRLTSFVNFDRAIARGIELTTTYRPVRRFVVNGTYMFLDSTVTEAAPVIDFATLSLVPNPEVGLPLIRRPRHSGSFSAAWIGTRFEANLSGVMVGKRRDIDPVTFSRMKTNLGYAKIDLAGGWNLSRRATLFARIENLLNDDYQEVLGYPAYRLTFSAGVRVKIGGEK
jgi:vitamin B12 transporter